MGVLGVPIAQAWAHGSVLVKVMFDAETENTPELQRQGWQAILDNFVQVHLLYRLCVRYG